MLRSDSHLLWGLGLPVPSSGAEITCCPHDHAQRSPRDARVRGWQGMQGDPPVDGDAPNPADRSQRLTGKAVSGVIWQGLAFVLGKGLVLAATIVLARILSPDEFGLVSLALVFIVFVEILADLGVSQALIYRRDSPRSTDAALACTIVTAFVTGGIVAASAPYIAEALGDRGITNFLRVLALSLALGSFGVVPDVLLRRDLLFRRRFIVQLSSNSARGIVSIALAVMGVGAWSLVYGYLAGQVVLSAVAWTCVRYRPDLRWHRLRWSDVRPLLAFGAPTAANGLLHTLIVNIDYIIISRTLGAAALGYYTLAFRLPEIVIGGMFQVLSMVVFPVFSRTRGQNERMRRGYLRLLRLQTTYGVVLGCVLAAVAPYLVPVLFGSGWEASVVPLQTLAIFAAVRSLGMGVVDVLKAVGRPGLALGLAVARLTVLVPALLLATAYGINGVAVAQATVALLFVVVMQSVAGRLLGVGPAQLLSACAPAVGAGILAAGCAALVAAFVPGGDLVRLLSGLAAAAAAAAAILLGLSPMTRRDLWSLFPRRGSASRAS